MQLINRGRKLAFGGLASHAICNRFELGINTRSEDLICIDDKMPLGTDKVYNNRKVNGNKQNLI